MNKKEFIKKLKGQLVISVQGVEGEPTNDAKFLAISSRAVVAGGAKILRCSQPKHIAAIKKEVPNIPMIGLIKRVVDKYDVFITPNKSDIDELAKLNVECIAIDATLRIRPRNEKLDDIVKYAKEKYPNIALMADCSNEEDVLNADKLGFDLISTTLRGYTKETKGLSNLSNDFEFTRLMLKKVKTPIVIEGGIWTPEDAKQSLKYSYASVVGSAITRPHLITEKFMSKVYNTK